MLLLALFRSSSSFDELSLERVIRVVWRGSDEKVPDFASDFWGEGGNDIIKTGLLCKNHMVELVGQNEGILMLMAVREGGGTGAVAVSMRRSPSATVPLTCMVASSVVTIGDCEEGIDSEVDGVR